MAANKVTSLVIGYGGNHEYHFEGFDTIDIEVYLDGMFVHGFDNMTTAIGHCMSSVNFTKDLLYVERNRN